MKNCTQLAVLLLGAIAAAGALQAQDHTKAARYIVYDTSAPAVPFAFGAGISNLGWITGGSLTNDGALHATLGVPAALIDLGTLGGANNAVEWPMKNSHALVIGISETVRLNPTASHFHALPFCGWRKRLGSELDFHRHSFAICNGLGAE